MRLAVMTVLFLITLMYCATQLNPANYGIYTLQGYEHGFAMCVEENNDDVIVLDDITIKVYPKYSLYVNKGHENDPELINLKVLATVECN